jgi:hypothetical protein
MFTSSVPVHTSFSRTLRGIPVGLSCRPSTDQKTEGAYSKTVIQDTHTGNGDPDDS